MSQLLIRDVEVDGRDGLDVLIAEGRIAAIGRAVEPRDCPELKGNGGALIPGLIDHHIHLLALAAEAASLRLGPDEARGPENFASLIRAQAAALPSGEWIRGVAYHESVAGVLDRHSLDRIAPDRPVRIQHRSGALWVLNSAALRAVEAKDGPDCVERDEVGPTGRIWRGDSWLRSRVPRSVFSLAGAARALAACGVTGVTDASATNDEASAALFAAARRNGSLPQKLCLMSGVPVAVNSAYEIGPVKLLLDDDRLDDLDAAAATMSAAHASGRKVAVHCVTESQLAFALAAFTIAEAEDGDRIEHAAMVGPEMAAQMAAMGLTVVTQPGFIAERGDQYSSAFEDAELDNLYPCATLMAAGIRVAASTDAPYTKPDPWSAIAAATHRTSRGGRQIGVHQRVGARRALSMFLGSFSDPGGAERRVDVGAIADLCLLRLPLKQVLQSPNAEHVAATVVGGNVVFG